MMRVIIDCAVAGESGLEVDPARIGMSGHSFGGWTTLATSHRDNRIRAALPLAPAGGRTPLAPPGVAGEMADSLELGWSRRVETLYLVAELDTLLPLEGMRDLLGRTPEPCRGINLLNADHFHFCDRPAEKVKIIEHIDILDNHASLGCFDNPLCTSLQT